MSFLTSRGRGFSGLRSAEIFGARKFVAGIIDDFIRTQLGRRIGAKAIDLPGEVDHREYEKQLQDQRSYEVTVTDTAQRSLTGKAWPGAGKCRTDGREKLAPARRPLDQKPGCVIKLDNCDLIELEIFSHFRIGYRRFGATRLAVYSFVWISIRSPNAVSVLAAVWLGNSRTDAACMRIGEKRQG
jgi:hypothetical protein